MGSESHTLVCLIGCKLDGNLPLSFLKQKWTVAPLPFRMIYILQNICLLTPTSVGTPRVKYNTPRLKMFI